MANTTRYPIGPLCICGHGEAAHNIGIRRGIKTRTACAHHNCPCKLYVPATGLEPAYFCL
jgi:hypothetical protein